MMSAASSASDAVPHAEQRSAWRSAAGAALYSGSAASVLSAIALAMGGLRQEGSAAGPLNGPSQWIWGEEEARTKRATLRHTLTGYVIHHLSSLLWATVHERVFRVRRSPDHAGRIVAQAITTAAFAYVVDYHLTPRRFRPGFRKHLTPTPIFVTYAAFAAGLALARLVDRDRSLQR